MIDSDTASSALEKQLGYQFQDSKLLTTALTHPSYSAEHKSQNADNQRLEFLGDAVLELALTDALFVRFPQEQEGALTKWRASLVSKPALAKFANELELGKALFIGKGEEANGGRQRDSNLADGLEAVLGAVYLDGGFDSAKELVLRIVSTALKEVTSSPLSGNPKGELQEALQAIGTESPSYSILSATGPDHEKKFTSRVTWQGQILGEGSGGSKKLAETEAAVLALKLKMWLPQ